MPTPINPQADDPFHAGEQALQQRTGMRERLAEVGARIVRDHMPEQHRELFAKLPFVLLGAVDSQGQPQAVVLAGPPGFVHAPDSRTLVVNALPHADGPLADALRPGAAVGVLGIEPQTRRRNRMNGVVRALGPEGFTIEVRQSFGNCPKYIQAREVQWSGAVHSPGRVSLRADRLDATALALVRAADTLFIASSCPPDQLNSTPAHGVDVSHRGGKPGFVRVDVEGDGSHTLTLPDFTGNFLFNTMGNLAVHPRAGLLFIDVDSGGVLHVACDADIVWEGDELEAFAGALRLLRFRVRRCLRIDGALPLRWGAAELSPFLRATGDWSASTAPAAR